MRIIKAFFIFCFLSLTIPLFAQDNEIAWNNGDKQDDKNTPVGITPDNDIAWVFDTPEKPEKEKVIEKKEKKKGIFRIPDRKFEIGLFNFNFGISNDFMTTSEIFKEKVSIDLDKLSDGFNFNANLYLSPLFINYNKNTWGFGLSTGLDLIGIFSLNGDMLTFHEADAEVSDIGAAIFTEMKLQGFFTFAKFKIKFKPAVYYPILYAKPDNFSYTYKNGKNIYGIDETYLNLKLDMRVYTAYSMSDDSDLNDIFNIANTIKNISAKPGIDIGLGVEYPLSDVLGITKKISILDFDVGIDFFNIPLYPAEMEDYMRMIVNLGSDEPIDFFNNLLSDDPEEEDIDDFYNYKVYDHEKERRRILRPFKTLISINWRPFGSPFKADNDGTNIIKNGWLIFTPIIGFAVNPLYYKPVSFEGGIKARLSFINLINITLNTGYYDRLWKNSLDFAFNIRLFEIDLGVSMQSHRFLKSWSGGGFGASFGLKFGW